MELIFVGILLGVCQGTLGVGVVLFGIPVYLYLGSNFTDAAASTLPISVACSILILLHRRASLPLKFITVSLLQAPFVIMFTIVMLSFSWNWLLQASYAMIVIGSVYTLYALIFNQNTTTRYFFPH